MIPACTGLPPGEFTRRITPCVFLSLKALCSALVTLSALAPPFASITPFTSTSEECLVPPSASARCQSNSTASRNVRYANPSSLKKMPQRRARRCSLMPSSASFSRTLRSQFSPISAIARSYFSEDHLAADLCDWDRDQSPAAARSAKAAPRSWVVQRTVSRAYQNQPLTIEEPAGLPVELDPHVRAPVDVRVNAALVPDRERLLEDPRPAQFEAHPIAAVDERRARAHHYAFAASHRASSSVEPTSASGASAASRDGSWAPYPTATAATPALVAISRSCEVSPIITVRSGAAATSSSNSRSMSGAGFGAHWSAQRVASNRSFTPVLARARARPARLLPVAIASACPFPRSPASISRVPGKRDRFASTAVK